MMGSIEMQADRNAEQKLRLWVSCMRQADQCPTRDFHNLTPEPVHLSPYAVEGTLWL